jgi:hypothetical protein
VFDRWILGVVVFFLSPSSGVVFIVGTSGFIINGTFVPERIHHFQPPLLRLAPTPVVDFVEVALPGSLVAGFHRGGPAAGIVLSSMKSPHPA